MILKGSQRGNAARLARHLMNARDNEHVELHELRGFMSEDDLHGALKEAEAIAKGTRCQQHLFSLSLNPPEGVHVDTATFEASIEMAEQRLGLFGQPRAVVFHEKEGRRHAHAVWSRIDTDSMTAVQLSFTKRRLMELSQELYLQHGWDMPKGMIDRAAKNPLSFTQAEWQQAQRAKQDPQILKALFKDAWQRSDSADSLKTALEERGYYLARGDRRGVVAVDYRGEAYALSRWSGVKAKDVHARFTGADALPSVDEQRRNVAGLMADNLRTHKQQIEDGYKRLRPTLEYKRVQMIDRHRSERTGLGRLQKQRETREAAGRAARLPERGFGKLWSRITGKYSKLKAQNEHDAWQSLRRDQAERDRTIMKQLDERQRLQAAIKKQREERLQELIAVRQQIANFMLMKRGIKPTIIPQQAKERSKLQIRPKDKTREGRKDLGRERSRPRPQGPEFER